MKLTRRDAAIALASLGVVGGTAIGVDTLHDRSSDPDHRLDDGRVVAIMTAVAEVVYPSEVTDIEDFVDAFLRGRLSRRDHGDGVRETVAELDRLAHEWHGDAVEDLPAGTREQLLREVGAETAEEDPSGTTAERVRYYVVNELLLGLFTSPAGGELLGLENPPGHPGGITSYARGP